MIRPTIFTIVLCSWLPALLLGQRTFPERVDLAFGSDQVLVNGIQFSNQYIRVDGNPYWLDDSFRSGSVCMNGFWYDALPLRYNIYSGKLEMQYLTREGHLNQIMTVPEHMSGFILDGQVFRRLELGPELPAFYQVLSSENWICYVGWSMDLLGGGSYELHFGPPKHTYWLAQGDPVKDPESMIRFHDRRTYLRAVPPPRKREFRKLLKNRKFSFTMAENREIVGMVEATLLLLESGR